LQTSKGKEYWLEKSGGRNIETPKVTSIELRKNAEVLLDFYTGRVSIMNAAITITLTIDVDVTEKISHLSLAKAQSFSSLA